MKSRVHPKYKTKYRVRNWASYERALIGRGNITIWLSRAAIAAWKPEGTRTRGAPPKYSDLAIETALVGAEFPAPLPNDFVRHDDSSFGQQILNIPEAHAVSVVEPDGMADDFGRKAMPKVAEPASVHPGIVLGGESATAP